ncbi:MAG: HAMP domain-containing histidine kinase [Acidobacteriia bacterium]|nr:HAMP domain-containing histidine kinase [Terriglobia bacterium]
MSAALLLVYVTVSLSVPRGATLAAFGDITQLLLLFIASVVMAANAVSERGQTRLFWSLMAVGCFMWTVSQGGWVFYEVLLRRDLPDPYFGDIVLFIHVVPFMAALALRPHLAQEERKLYFSTLNFLMLLIWWVFLYAFIVFPDEYVAMNVQTYSRNYDVLYLVENLVLLGALGLLTAGTRGAWRTIYRNLTISMALYTFCSEAMNAAIARGQYYTGSIYDIPFVAGVCWLVWVGLLARKLKPTGEPPPPERSRWMALAPRLAMIAILSLPVMGFWAVFYLDAPIHLRHFRLLVTLAATLVLGICVFIRQYLLDHELMRLLDTSHRSLENLQRLQSQLVQKEKLASLGQLVAGAAHEINNPLAAILGYAELLSSNGTLGSNQVSMAQKIGQQARRTRDLVSDLLSFARQAPAEKALVDLGSLLHRAVQMETLQLEGKKVRVETRTAPDLPRIWGNANQLFQCCLQIIGNAMDALEEVGGGVLTAEARREGDEVVLEFSDSGPGIREPLRVFDPFYTTKPIGKGTGLGLSATYGVVQDHHGQIACHNHPEGGAVFVLHFPVATTATLPEAQAAKA